VKRCLPAIGLFLCAVTALAAGGRPWKARWNQEVETFHITAHRNTPLSLWPAEPASPPEVTEDSFARALGMLCRSTSDERIKRYTAWILEDSAAFQVDPFLLAALVYDQSDCRPVAPRRYGDRGLFGLTHFPLAMHAPHVRRNTYTWYRPTADGWTKEETILPFALNRSTAAAARSNIALSAAVLHIFTAQRPGLARLFPDAPARHAVSHFFFGDRVRNPEPENRVLTARRRLMEYWRNAAPAVVGRFKSLELYAPLDGAPRLVLDYFGNPRGAVDGTGHRGIDLDGAIGEPVRAVADGRVTFTGMDLPGALANRRVTTAELATLSPSDIPQGGGLYVSILHGDGVTSMSMHLSSFCVDYNQTVRGGEIIGTMGQSGAAASGPHLHFELLDGENRTDPAVPLSLVLVNPHAAAPGKSVRTAD